MAMVTKPLLGASAELVLGITRPVHVVVCEKVKTCSSALYFVLWQLPALSLSRARVLCVEAAAHLQLRSPVLDFHLREP